MPDQADPELPPAVFRAAVDEAPAGVGIADTDGTILYANESNAEIFGFDDPEDLVGRPWQDLYDDEAAARIEEQARAAVREDATWRGDVVGRRRDGSPVPLAISVSLAAGYVVVVVRDVTQQRERERELERKNERLEEFASVLSHDLRNPLNVAVGWLDVAREERDAETLDRVAEALDRMGELIEDLLALSRRGEAVETLSTVDLADAVQRAWSTVETHEAELDLESSRAIEADRERLVQLLENLVRNAVEHGGESVVVRVGDLEDGFYVADTGGGIPESDREAILEPGYSTSSGGTGFGLTIVQRIAGGHGWDLAVRESAEGGARFEFRGVDVE